MGSVGVGGVWHVHYGTGLCIIGGSCKNSYALIFRYVQGNRVHRLELEHWSISSSAVSIHSFAALGFQFVCGTHSACPYSMLPWVQVTTGLGFLRDY